MAPQQTTEELLKELAAIEQQENTLELNRVELYMQKGKILLQLKEHLPHGEFLPSLKKAKLNTNPRQAQRMMELAANEDIIKSNATDLSHLTLEKAFTLIKKKKKAEQLETPAIPQVIVGQFNVTTAFHAASQTYAIMVEIKAQDRKWMQCSKNQKNVAVAVKKALEQLVQSPCLTDLTMVQPN